jgi:putative heme-binding domain-containing protein
MKQIALLITLFAVTSAHAQLQWIWNNKKAQDKEKASFRTSFTAPADLSAASLQFTCDNGAKALINGSPVAENPDWQQPTTVDVLKAIKPGKNEILINATNHGGSAGLIVKLTLTTKDKKTTEIVTNPQWEASTTGKDDWHPAVGVGRYGAGPWGDALSGKGGGGKNDAGTVIDPKDVAVLPGFKVELLYTVPKAEQGSWVSMTTDPKGRLICGDQYGGLYRVTVPPVGSGDKAQIEKIPSTIGGAHGLLYANNTLYIMNNEKATPDCKPGLWRMKDKGDGTFDAPEYLRAMAGGGEHGPHSMQIAPDGSGIYFNCGNHTKLPDNVEKSRMVMGLWGEDHILPRMWDANGHARGILAPGGYICKTDWDAKSVEIIAMGFRNEFDFGLDANGEMIAYDADMEWDIGAPWYRPTRMNHVVSGADFGWRSGSGKWPAYYEDSLPAGVDIGPGSPTGCVFGTGAKFPAKYQRAFYGNDWTYGTMWAIHTEPSGAGLKMVKEEFLSGKPLPLTDVIINPVDGAMYFAVGGRKTQSGLYRVTYEGKESTAPAPAYEVTAEAKQRHEIEKLHADGAGPEAIAKIWPALNSADRNLRYAARIALERQPVTLWKDKALNETNVQASIDALIALARVSRAVEAAPGVDPNVKPAKGASTGPVPPATSESAALQLQITNALGRLDLNKLDTDHQLQLVRAYQLAFTRLGKPDGAACAAVAARLEPSFPSKNASVDRELCQLLVFLDSKMVVAKTLALVATAADDSEALASDAVLARNAGYAGAAEAAHKSRPNRQQIALMWSLCNATAGWNAELRKTYFTWFPHARTWKGGNSFKGFIDNARKEALANFVPNEETTALDTLSSKDEPVPVNFVPAEGPGKNWTIDEVVALTKDGLKGRNFEHGKAMFTATSCVACHHFAGDGGNIGPDLTGSGSRYTMRDFMENIVEPSKVISDQYGSHQIEKKDGSLILGRIVAEQGDQVMVMTSPFAPTQLTAVKTADIKSKKDYPVSMMPPGLINILNKDELLDLIAYVMSGGNANDKAFK